MSNLELKTAPYFNQEELVSFFREERGWPVSTIPVDQVNLVPTMRGAALECSDGRFDDCPGKIMHGPRVFGQINAIRALKTGGDLNGVIEACGMIRDLGYNAGTHTDEHSGCGYFNLWDAGRFSHAIYPNEITFKEGEKPGQFIKVLMRSVKGKHFRLNGDHVEEGVRLNPFVHVTEQARGGDRFRVDDWFLALLDIPQLDRMMKVAETVELLKPEAAKLEIITKD